MKYESVIQHPESSPLVMLRSEFLAITNNHCAAKLLAIFEFWTNKLKQTGKGTREWIYKSVARLHEELMGEHGTNSIRAAINILTEKGFLEKQHNPHIKYDRTYQYRLNVEKVQKALQYLIYPEDQMDFTPQDNGFVHTEESICPESENNNIDSTTENNSYTSTQNFKRKFKNKSELIQYVANYRKIPIPQAYLLVIYWFDDWVKRPDYRQKIREQLEEVNLTPDVLNPT